VSELTVTETPFDSLVVQRLLAGWDEELAAIDPRLPPAGGSTVRASDFAPPAGIFLLATSEHRPVGCGGVRRLRGATGEVKRLFVPRVFRGRGVGRAVLEALEERARARGIEALRLDTAGDQPAALTLFRSAGYRPIADYNGNPYARYWFEKRLGPGS
jgi:GNAT superfamily N-acetyltransferase